MGSLHWLLRMDREMDLGVAASRQSAATARNVLQRRSAETPLRGHSGHGAAASRGRQRWHRGYVSVRRCGGPVSRRGGACAAWGIWPGCCERAAVANTRRRPNSVCWEYDAILEGPVHDQSRHVNRRQQPSFTARVKRGPNGKVLCGIKLTLRRASPTLAANEMCPAAQQCGSGLRVWAR